MHNYSNIGESTPPCLTPLEIENLLEERAISLHPSLLIRVPGK